MKNIELALNEQLLKPSRPLKNNFTSTVMSEIKKHPKPRRWSLFNSIKTKITILSLGLLLVAGTAAAAVTTIKNTTQQPKQSPPSSVSQTIVKRLDNGNQVVGYDLKNCHFFSSPTYVDTDPSRNVYYEVLPGATFTDQQLKASLEGTCQSMVNADAMGAIIQNFTNENVTPYDGFSTLNMVVQSITPTSISVKIDPAYTVVPIAPQDKVGLTYTQYFSGLKVYDQNTPVAYSDIKVGDDVQLYMGHTPGYTYTVGGVAQEATPDQDILYAIMKVPPLTADPTLYFLSIGKYLQQVTPCKSNSSGYCQAQPPKMNTLN